MINIIIDGNYFFYKTFGVFTGFDKKLDPSLVLKDSSQRSMFIRKVSTDLCAALKELPQGGRLVFTMDSSSWRKEIEIEGGGYKSGRKKNESVDWTTFFDLLNQFGLHLESKGFIFSKVNRAEGDDLIYFWSRKFISEGESCIILSADEDLHQLVYSSDSVWSGVWNVNPKKNILSVCIGWDLEKSNEKKEASVFDMGFTLSPQVDKMKSFLKKVQINRVDVREFLFKKMLLGDSGDSVPSVWEFEQNSKLVRFTEKKAEQAYNFFLESEWSNKIFDDLILDHDFILWISSLILKIQKQVDSSENREKVGKNFLRNVSLMWLDKKILPADLIDLSMEELERGSLLPKKNITFDRLKILEGSDWITTGFVPKDFNPFEL